MCGRNVVNSALETLRRDFGGDIIEPGGAGYESASRSRLARRFGLRYQEINGSLDLVYPLLHGPWDERFIVVPMGGTVALSDFLGDGAPGRKQLSRHPVRTIRTRRAARAPGARC